MRQLKRKLPIHVCNEIAEIKTTYPCLWWDSCSESYLSVSVLRQLKGKLPIHARDETSVVKATYHAFHETAVVKDIYQYPCHWWDSWNESYLSMSAMRQLKQKLPIHVCDEIAEVKTTYPCLWWDSCSESYQFMSVMRQLKWKLPINFLDDTAEVKATNPFLWWDNCSESYLSMSWWDSCSESYLSMSVMRQLKWKLPIHVCDETAVKKLFHSLRRPLKKRPENKLW